MLLTAAAGALLGYGIGRRAGPVLLPRRGHPAAAIARAEGLFERYGCAKAIVLARFTPPPAPSLTPSAG